MRYVLIFSFFFVTIAKTVVRSSTVGLPVSCLQETGSPGKQVSLMPVFLFFLA